MQREEDKNVIYVTIAIVLAIIILGSGLYIFSGYFVSDWEYEHYYSITIATNSSQTYKVIVPLPSGKNAQTSDNEPVYRQYYIDNLQKSYGNASYEIINSSFVSITGIGSLLLESNFILWDTYANVSIEEHGSNNAIVYSNTSEISIILDSRAVRKSGESWELFHSSLIEHRLNFPVPSKVTWKTPLSNEYLTNLDFGWNEYEIQQSLSNNITII